MTTINHFSSTPASSLTSVKAASNPSAGNAQISINDISTLLQEVYQKMRNILQKQNVTQSINSFNIAKKAVEKKHESADKTRDAAMINANFALAGGCLGGGLGLVPSLAKGMGKGINYFSKAAEGGSGTAAFLKKFGEKTQEPAMALAPTLPGVFSGIGAMQSAEPSREASNLQTTSDYLKDSHSSYDRQRDNDMNSMRMFSQKITEVSRALADVHGATVNALTWK
jgi:hypothetical protein